MSDWDNFWNNVGNAVEQTVDWVGDTFENVGASASAAFENVGASVVDVLENVGDAFENVGEAAINVLENVAEDVVDVFEDVNDWTLTVADTVIFDPVDFITGGAINVDYENGQLINQLDLGFGSVGVAMGAQGFGAYAGFDIGIARGNVNYDSASGLDMGGAIGFDSGPLPYAEGHLTIGNDGSISIGGELQATLPLPFGTSVGGDFSGEVHRNADGSYGASSLVDVFADGLGDTGARFHNDNSVEFGRDGFDIETNTDASIRGLGGTGGNFHTDAAAHLDRDGFDAATNTDVSMRGPGGTGGIFHTGSSADLGPDGFDAATNADLLMRGPGGTGANLHAGSAAHVGPDGVLIGTEVAGAATGPDGKTIGADGHAGLGLGAGKDGTQSAAISAGGGVDTGDREFDMELPQSMSGLAGSGDLSETLDDFTSEIVNTKAIEDAADDVWDNLGQ